MSSSKEKANLARIRDNQRRSRARRKEYLQELEARLRQCELQGIEASSEIQMAARRVADENKKLRGLLAQHGIGEDSVETYLQTSPADVALGGSYMSSSGAVQILEQLLQTRKACCIDGNNPQLPHMGDGEGSRDSSASIGTVSMWEPASSRTTSGRRRSENWQQLGGKAASSAQQFMTPSTSAASQTSSVVSLGLISNRGVAHHRGIASAQMRRNTSPVSNQSHQNHQSIFDFDSHLSLNPYSSHQGTAQKHLQPREVPQRSSVYMPTHSTGNVNNCNYAAEIITTMAGVGDPSAVRADLGCLPNGMDCEVDNLHVFNVMDRYSGVGL
jgi:hypothetical protein